MNAHNTSTKSTTSWRASAEFEIVTCLAVFPFDDAAQIRAKTALEKSYDAQILLDLVRFHRLAVHIARNLNVLRPENIDRDLRIQLARLGAYAEKRGQEQVKSLLDIMGQFSAEGIAMMPIKGPATAERLYGDTYRRTLHDIDILVPPKQTSAAVKKLGAMGFREVKPVLRDDFSESDIKRLQKWGSNIGFVHPDNEDILVELHWRPGRYQREFPISSNKIWSGALPLSISGQEAQSLDPIHEVLFLCSHGCKHEFKRLHWLLDIAAIANDENFDWTKAVAVARELKIENYLALSLGLANIVFRCEIPKPAKGLWMRNAKIQQRADQILHRRYSNHPKNDNSWQEAKMEWCNAALLPGLSHRLATLLSHLRPGPDDWNWVGLPRPISFLYYPVRLIRISITLVKARVS